MQRWQIGDVRVTRVVESVEPADTEFLLPQATPAELAPHAAWLRPHFAASSAGHIITNGQAWQFRVQQD